MKSVWLPACLPALTRGGTGFNEKNIDQMNDHLKDKIIELCGHEYVVQRMVSDKENTQTPFLYTRFCNELETLKGINP